MKKKSFLIGLVSLVVPAALFLTTISPASHIDNVHQTTRNKVDATDATSFTVNSSATWQISNFGKTLTIGGNGATDNFSTQADIPWLENLSTITKVVISKNITSIGDNLFNGLENLERVVINDDSELTSIGSQAFKGCNSLISFTIPKKVTSIGVSAFENCTSLKNVVIPSKVSSLGTGAYMGCSSLVSFEIESTLIDTLPDHALANCPALKFVNLSESITTLGDYCFFDSDKINEIIIQYADGDENLIEFGENSFSGTTHASSLYQKSVTLYINPEVSISAYETKFEKSNGTSFATNFDFVNYSTLSNGEEVEPWYVVLKQQGVLYIGGYGAIPNATPSHDDGYFTQTEFFTSVKISDNITSIGDEAFFGLDNIRSVKLGKKITSIGENAFIGCDQLASIVIPKSVTEIKTQAFYGCSALNEIEFENNTPSDSFFTSIGENAFGDDTGNHISNTGTVYVPKDTENLYAGKIMINGTSEISWNIVEKAVNNNFTFNLDNNDTFYEDKELTITNANKFDHIYYTLDNSTPNESTNEYVDKIDITGETGALTVVTVKVAAYKEGWEPSQITTLVLNIHKKGEVTAPLEDTNEYVYTGSPITYGIPESEDYTITNNTQTNAGTYSVIVSLKDKTNTVWSDTKNSEDKTFTFTIEKASYDMSGVKFNTSSANMVTLPYNGEEQEILISGNLPSDEITVTYEGNKLKNVSSSIAIAHFTSTNENYNPIPDISVQFYISRKYISLPSEDETEYIYDGQEKTYVVADSLDYIVTNVTRTVAGEQDVIITLADDQNTCWNNSSHSADPLTYRFEIKKATYDISNLSFQDKTVDFTGEVIVLQATGVPEGVVANYVITQEGIISEAKNIGVYNVHVTFTIDEDNYNTITPRDAVLTINKKVVAKPQKDTTKYVYTGQEITYVVAESTFYTVSNNVHIEPDTYTVYIELNDAFNTCWEGDDTNILPYTFKIDRASYDLTDLIFEDTEYEYDNKAHTLVYIGELPDGVVAHYTDNSRTEIGSIDVTLSFTVDETHYYPIEPITKKLTITQIGIDVPTIGTTSFVYDGKEHSVSISENPLYTITGNAGISVGTYSATISIGDKSKFMWADTKSSEDRTVQFEITKATYNMAGVKFESATKSYTGSPLLLTITGTLPEGVSVKYTGSRTTVGQVVVKVEFIGDSSNYNAIPERTATLTIIKATVAKPAAINTDFIYNGRTQTYNLLESPEYTILDNTRTKAGTQNVTVKLKDTENYEWADHSIDDLTYTFTIKKATYDMSNVTFENETVDFTGIPYFITIKGTLPEGVTAIYSTDGYIKTGTHTISVSFAGDSENYNPIPSMSARLTISEAIGEVHSEGDLAMIESDYGFAKEATLGIVEVTQTKDTYSSYISDKEEILLVYSISLFDAAGEKVNNLVFEEESTVLLKIKLPKGYEKINFKIIHYHSAELVTTIVKGDKATIGTYVIEDGYIVTQIPGLSYFAFASQKVSKEATCIYHWALLGLLVATIIFNSIWFYILKNHKLTALPLIVIIIHTCATIALTAMGNGCILCIIFGSINIVAIVGAIVQYLIGTKRANAELLRLEEQVMSDVTTAKSDDNESDYVYVLKKNKDDGLSEEERQKQAELDLLSKFLGTDVKKEQETEDIIIRKVKKPKEEKVENDESSTIVEPDKPKEEIKEEVELEEKQEASEVSEIETKEEVKEDAQAEKVEEEKKPSTKKKTTKSSGTTKKKDPSQKGESKTKSKSSTKKPKEVKEE